MSEREFVLDLARVVISAAWADGDLSNEEINALKDLIFRLDEISGDDWTKLEMYMESSARRQEQEELERRLLDSIRSATDKSHALDILDRLVHADGSLSSEEELLLARLRDAIEDAETGLLGGISRIFKSAITRRNSAVRTSFLRETGSDDYVKNTIFYDLMRRQQATGERIGLPEDSLREICLATGLLSYVAHADSEISREEMDTIADILASDWNLPKSQARLLAGISCDRAMKGLDYFRLSVGFFECTTHDERCRLLDTLFRVANAAGKTQNGEIEEIRFIAKCLKMSHRDFIAAKLTIPREDRNGL